jgi:hypothetical protein
MQSRDVLDPGSVEALLDSSSALSFNNSEGLLLEHARSVSSCWVPLLSWGCSNLSQASLTSNPRTEEQSQSQLV